ncbi:hypothetical protein AOR02nite_13210 [Acetobacter orientalis]|nr:hypothetical protein AOR02nite_13210 [Acetobacter orientalis]
MTRLRRIKTILNLVYSDIPATKWEWSDLMKADEVYNTVLGSLRPGMIEGVGS